MTNLCVLRKLSVSIRLVCTLFCLFQLVEAYTVYTVFSYPNKIRTYISNTQGDILSVAESIISGRSLAICGEMSVSRRLTVTEIEDSLSGPAQITLYSFPCPRVTQLCLTAVVVPTPQRIICVSDKFWSLYYYFYNSYNVFDEKWLRILIY